MITKEELLKCFQTEITAISEAEIAAAQCEMQEIANRVRQEIYDDAQAAAQLWFEQEAEDLRANRAVQMSHINDDSHRRLMKERSAMVEALFAEAKEQLLNFHQDKKYQDYILNKLKTYTDNEEAKVLQLGNEDEALIKKVSDVLKNTQVVLVDDITLGGFRLILKQQNKLIDETMDSALAQARKAFLKNSELTIS